MAKQCFVQDKDFIPPPPANYIDWFINPITVPYDFEEGNMSSISLTIKVYILVILDIIKKISLGALCS